MRRRLNRWQVTWIITRALARLAHSYLRMYWAFLRLVSSYARLSWSGFTLDILLMYVWLRLSLKQTYYRKPFHSEVKRYRKVLRARLEVAEPGRLIGFILSWFYSKRSIERVFMPVLDDMRFEYYESCKHGLVRAKITLWRWRTTLFQVMVRHAWDRLVTPTPRVSK